MRCTGCRSQGREAEGGRGEEMHDNVDGQLGDKTRSSLASRGRRPPRLGPRLELDIDSGCDGKRHPRLEVPVLAANDFYGQGLLATSAVPGVASTDATIASPCQIEQVAPAGSVRIANCCVRPRGGASGNVAQPATPMHIAKATGRYLEATRVRLRARFCPVSGGAP